MNRALRAVQLTLALCLGACAAPPEVPANLLFISLDTTRQDHLSLYGYKRPTTPRLEALAETAAVFDNAFAQSTITTPTHISMFTGLYPTVHGVGLTTSERQEKVTLAGILADQGFRTGAFVSGYPLRMQNHGLRHGFEIWDSKFKGMRRAGHRTVGLALDWLRDIRPEERFMLFVHIYDAHGPYRPKPEYRSLFRSNDRGPKLDYVPAYQLALGQESTEGELYANDFVDRYDAQLRAQDDLVGKLLDSVDLSDTIVVIVADHGETFFERVDYLNLTHGSALFDEQLRIPYVIHAPGVAPGRFSEPVEQVDLTPTVLDLLEIPAPPRSNFQGESLAPLVRGERGERHDGLIFANATYEARRYPHLEGNDLVDGKLAAVRSTTWKLVFFPTSSQEGYYQLYDLVADPGELNNLAAAEPEALARFRTTLDAWQADSVADAPPGELSEEDLRQLRSLGYVD